MPNFDDQNDPYAPRLCSSQHTPTDPMMEHIAEGRYFCIMCNRHFIIAAEGRVEGNRTMTRESW